jgi:hypothetical protein
MKRFLSAGKRYGPCFSVEHELPTTCTTEAKKFEDGETKQQGSSWFWFISIIHQQIWKTNC